MATVKLSDGKVVTKDGKVSCECCDVRRCCVFEAQFATAGDLPAVINFYGGELTVSGTSYGDTTNGVILEGNEWGIYRDGARTSSACISLPANGATTANVYAELATSYLLEFTWQPDGFDPFDLSFTMTLHGNPLSPHTYEAADEPCLWFSTSTTSDPPSQFFDEGVILYRSLGSWKIYSGVWPDGVIIAIKDSAQGDPAGSYSPLSGYEAASGIIVS
jgi:hypothetical protein